MVCSNIYNRVRVWWPLIARWSLHSRLRSKPKKENQKIKRMSSYEYFLVSPINTLFYWWIYCYCSILILSRPHKAVLFFKSKLNGQRIRFFIKWSKFLLLSIPTVWQKRSSFSWGRWWLWVLAVRFRELLLYCCFVPIGQLWECTSCTTSWGAGWPFEKTRVILAIKHRSRLDMKATATNIVV